MNIRLTILFWLIFYPAFAMMGPRSDLNVCTSPKNFSTRISTPVEGSVMDEALMMRLAKFAICYDNADIAKSKVTEIFGNAPEDVQSVALALYMDKTPEMAWLKTLDFDALNASYAVPNERTKRASLFVESYRMQNYQWAKALAELGLDISIMNNSAPDHAAMFMHSKEVPYLAVFRDYSLSIPFLELFLNYGGDVNAARGTNLKTPIVNEAKSVGNLEGIIYLLSRGADGWYVADPDLPFDSALFPRMMRGGGSPYANETMFRVIKADQFRLPDDPAHMDRVMADYVEMLEEFRGTKGAFNRATLWTLQQTLDALIESTGITPPDRMVELLETDRVPDSEGGWLMPASRIQQAPNDKIADIRDTYPGPYLWEGN